MREAKVLVQGERAAPRHGEGAVPLQRVRDRGEVQMTPRMKAVIKAWDDLTKEEERQFFQHLHETRGITDVDALIKSTDAHKEYMLVLDRKLSLEIGLDQDLPRTA